VERAQRLTATEQWPHRYGSVIEGGGTFDPEKTLSAVDPHHDSLIHINLSERAAITSKARGNLE